MPDQLLDHLRGWRARADEARADAKAVTDPRLRETMMNIAAGYQRLCQEADLLRRHKKGSAPKLWRTRSDSE
jgi:hypothetical protein